MTTHTLNSDYLLERLRQRGPIEYDGGYCLSCEVQLTAADTEAGECTNCHASLVKDESADEDLFDDLDQDYLDDDEDIHHAQGYDD